MKLFGMTDVGCVRASNQDAFAIDQNQDFSYILVCDGMGGHLGGDIASQLAVESLTEFFTDQFDPSLPSEDIVTTLKEAINRANRKIFSESLKNISLKGMGTTVVMAVAIGQTLYVAHVGDSRAYIWDGENFSFITKDHSLVQEMMDKGELTAEEAAVHPYRHVITRVLGISPDVRVELTVMTASETDLVLLCSDGLSNLVSAETLTEEIRKDDPETLCDRLITLAKDNGGNDNITVAIMQNGGIHG